MAEKSVFQTDFRDLVTVPVDALDIEIYDQNLEEEDNHQVRIFLINYKLSRWNMKCSIRKWRESG